MVNYSPGRPGARDADVFSDAALAIEQDTAEVLGGSASGEPSAPRCASWSVTGTGGKTKIPETR